MDAWVQILLAAGATAFVAGLSVGWVVNLRGGQVLLALLLVWPVFILMQRAANTFVPYPMDTATDHLYEEIASFLLSASGIVLATLLYGVGGGWTMRHIVSKEPRGWRP